MAPPTIAMAGMGSTIAGGMLGAFGSAYQGASQRNMYQYQAGVSQINAMIAEQNAKYALTKGEKEAERYGMKAGQQAGAIKAAQASGGLDVNSGSNKQVQDSQKMVARMDMATIRENASKVAYDYTVQATGFRNQAALQEMAGDNAMTAGIIGSLGSFIGTSGSVSSRWLQGQQMGMWGV